MNFHHQLAHGSRNPSRSRLLALAKCPWVHEVVTLGVMSPEGGADFTFVLTNFKTVDKGKTFTFEGYRVDTVISTNGQAEKLEGVYEPRTGVGGIRYVNLRASQVA